MKKNSDLPLDESALGSLITFLEEAYVSGFSTDESSPLIPLLEILIDLNLRMSYFFKKGGPLEKSKNPSIKELDRADALGNAKMIKVFDIPSWVHPDPKISFIFKRNAENLVSFKRTGNPIYLATFAVTKYKEIQASRTPPRNSVELKESNSPSYYYWRRKRKARKRGKQHIST